MKNVNLNNLAEVPNGPREGGGAVSEKGLKELTLLSFNDIYNCFIELQSGKEIKWYMTCLSYEKRQIHRF